MKCQCNHIFRTGEPCGHEWESRLPDNEVPEKCPKCNQYKVTAVYEPKKCPKCGEEVER